jgi:rhamnosyltransferase
MTKSQLLVANKNNGDRSEQRKHIVYAVVVVYNPDLKILESLLEITLPMVQRIVIVNNDQNADTLTFLNTCEESLKIKLIPMTRNVGLAAGMNAGIEWSIQAGCSHVLLLDQDSIPQNNMVDRLLSASDHIASTGIRVAAVGASHLDPRSGYTSSFGKIDKSSNYAEVKYLQSSGSLISTTAIQSVGLMDDGLFIHHIDQEWCMRAASQGYESFGVSDAWMNHIVGDDIVRIWLGYWRDIHLHSPLRHYFAFRNSVLLYGRDYIPWDWKLQDFARLVFMFIFYALFSTSRREHIYMMVRGARDGWQKKTGEASVKKN